MIEKNLLIQIKNKNLDYLNENKTKLINNDVCDHNRTILMYCLKFNLLDFFEQQIENLQNPYHKDLSNYTILDYTIKHDVKYFKKLLDKFDYQNFIENENWPHKFLAISFNNYEILKKLIEQDNKVDILKENFFTLLNYSIILKRTDMSIYLLNQNANYEKKDNRGWNSLFFSYYYNQLEVIKYIKKICSEKKFDDLISQKDVFGKFPSDYLRLYKN
jgi:hypothetical protein